MEWVRGTGAWFSEPMEGNLGYGHGARFDVYDFVARCAAIVESAGGSVVRSCRLRELVTDANGVAGAIVADRDGETEIEARAIVLATGGWQGNPRLRLEYLGPNAGALRLRANAYSTGDALEAALAIGAGTTERMEPFYGHLVAHPIEHFEPGDYLRLSQIWCYYGVLLDLTGQRFTDESTGYHTCAQDLLNRPGSRGLLFADEEVRQRYVAPPLNTGLEAIDRLAEAGDEGAHVVSATSIEALAASVAAWGYDEARVVRTLHGYNRAMRAGGEPPGGVARKRYRIGMTTAPFYAMEVIPAITFTHGGLRTDEHARVLTASGQAIRGLYAVGSDAAGAFCRGYAGGLANAAVFGLRAAADASRTVAAH
jgi:succinate dehydrogenase/fumarate reductase flavoprotein subunit